MTASIRTRPVVSFQSLRLAVGGSTGLLDARLDSILAPRALSGPTIVMGCAPSDTDDVSPRSSAQYFAVDLHGLGGHSGPGERPRAGQSGGGEGLASVVVFEQIPQGRAEAVDVRRIYQEHRRLPPPLAATRHATRRRGCRTPSPPAGEDRNLRTDSGRRTRTRYYTTAPARRPGRSPESGRAPPGRAAGRDSKIDSYCQPRAPASTSA